MWKQKVTGDGWPQTEAEWGRYFCFLAAGFDLLGTVYQAWYMSCPWGIQVAQLIGSGVSTFWSFCWNCRCRCRRVPCHGGRSRNNCSPFLPTILGKGQIQHFQFSTVLIDLTLLLPETSKPASELETNSVLFVPTRCPNFTYFFQHNLKCILKESFSSTGMISRKRRQSVFET